MKKRFWLIHAGRRGFVGEDSGAADSKDELARERKIYFCTCDHGFPILREADTEQVRQVLRASTVVQMLAASDTRMREYCFRLYREKKLLPSLPNGSTFLENVSKMK